MIVSVKKIVLRIYFIPLKFVLLTNVRCQSELKRSTFLRKIACV